MLSNRSIAALTDTGEVYITGNIGNLPIQVGQIRTVVIDMICCENIYYLLTETQEIYRSDKEVANALVKVSTQNDEKF